MSNFNFSGVDVPAENTSTFIAVQPGYQNLTVKSVEDVKSQSGTLGVKVTFESDKGGEFSQSWWLADSSGNELKTAMPSFQYLMVKFSGEKLEGNISTDLISAKLVGKTTDVTVGGRRYTSEKDGKKYNNTAAWLPFSGWAGNSTVRYTGEWESEDTNTLETATAKTDDLPF